VLKCTSTSSCMQCMSADAPRVQGGEKQVPVTYILQQYNQPKAVHKLPDEERSILSPREIGRMKEVQHERAREEQRRRREYMKLREEEARTPEPIVPTLAPDPPLPPVFDPLQDTYRYRYNENQAGWIVRPFVDSNGPDRSDGINGGQAERQGIVRLPKQFIGGSPSRVLFQVRPPRVRLAAARPVHISCASHARTSREHLACGPRAPPAHISRACHARPACNSRARLLRTSHALVTRSPRAPPARTSLTPPAPRAPHTRRCAVGEGQGEHGARV
jgi:hypothetical protein